MDPTDKSLDWSVAIGDLVWVKSYDFTETSVAYLPGIVISEKYEDQNTLFPCIRVHVFAENDWRECFPHELEVISSG